MICVKEKEEDSKQNKKGVDAEPKIKPCLNKKSEVWLGWRKRIYPFLVPPHRNPTHAASLGVSLSLNNESRSAPL